jgi:hypothetical protein
MLPVSGALQLRTCGASAGLGLQLGDQRQRGPGVAGAAELGEVAVVLRLDGLDLGGQEGADPLGQVSGPRRG